MAKRLIVDCFLFYNETSMLEYRLKVLWDIVDFFVICEASKTFVGNDKPFYSTDPRFDVYRSKMVSIRINDFPFPVPSIPNKEQWENENYQRNRLSDGVLTLLENNRISLEDLIIIGDVDEIPDTEALLSLSTINESTLGNVYVLCQKYYSYDLETIRCIDWYHAKYFHVRHGETH